MYELPENYFMIYNNDLEQHVDSSDFEETFIPLATPKNGNHSLVRLKKHSRRTRNSALLNKHREDPYLDCDEYPIKLSKLNNNDKPFTRNLVPERKLKYKHKKPQNIYSGDHVHKVRSKLSVMRQKIIPCLSSIFKRSNNLTKPMSVIKENRVENICTDKCCQRCSDCERRRMRKLYKSQNYAVQPVYAIEGNVHNTPAPFGRTKITEKPLQNHNRKTSKNQSCSCCSLSSSCNSDTQPVKERQHKVKKFRKRLKTEILKYQSNQQNRNKQNQYPSKDHKTPYHVFMTPSQSRTQLSPAFSGQFDEMPSSSASFWDFLFEKVSKKYQTQKVAMPVQNDMSRRAPCYAENCPMLMEQKPQQNERPACSGTECPYRDVKRDCFCKETQKDSTGEQGLKLQNKIKKEKEKAKTKVSCECTPVEKKTPCPKDKDCQDCHDQIKESLEKKYNGEVLCIHNPPCILINGCLNFPTQKDTKEKEQLNFWPLTESKKYDFFNFGKKENSCREQSCQYQVQVPTQQSGFRTEKKIQSICNHDPPCEVVRGCYKPKYDPYLQNSCIHVPMCKKVAECAVGKRDESPCEHRPRCREIPMCSKNYMLLTARETIGTQATPEAKDHVICRHIPPCVMIPKCIGRVCESYLPINVVPECVHHPLCEKIPACCRKNTKEMVSVSSQYPNSCRIV